MPDTIPFDVYSHKTVWPVFDYIRDPLGKFIGDWTLKNPPKANPGDEDGLWKNVVGDEQILVYRTKTWLKMLRGDFDGLDYLFYPLMKLDV